MGTQRVEYKFYFCPRGIAGLADIGLADIGLADAGLADAGLADAGSPDPDHGLFVNVSSPISMSIEKSCPTSNGGSI